MNIRNIGIALVVLVILAGGFIALGGGENFAPKPTPTPETALNEYDNLITASGTLVPAKRANLSFKMAGQVVQIPPKQGDVVKQGDALMRLDDAELRAGVAVAQAQLDQLLAGATREQIAAAQAALEVAQAQLAKVRAGATAEDIAIAKATLDRAQAGLQDAQAAYDKIKDDPAAGMYPQAAAYQAAVQQLSIAQAGYQKVLKGATPEDIRIAEANVSAAQAEVKRVQAGARAEEIAAGQARLSQAKAALVAATLVAPFDGTIAAINIKEGEMATPGVPVVTLGDLTGLRLETDDLSETNVGRVKIGQAVNVTFEALPSQTFVGKVTQIAPISSQKQGGTNYTVTIEFERLDPALRWGMTGHIEIDAK